MIGKSQSEAVNVLRGTQGLVKLLVQREETVLEGTKPAIEVHLLSGMKRSSIKVQSSNLTASKWLFLVAVWYFSIKVQVINNNINNNNNSNSSCIILPRGGYSILTTANCHSCGEHDQAIAGVASAIFLTR